MLRFPFAACLVLLSVMSAGARPPDIILMMADDLGFSDLGCYGSEMWLFDEGKEVQHFADDFFYTDAISQRAAEYILDQPNDLYTSDSGAAIEYLIQVPDDRTCELRLIYAAHENRGHSVPVTITHGIESTKRLINMQRRPTAGYYKSLGTVTSRQGPTVRVRIEARGAGGIVHADAIQLVESK